MERSTQLGLCTFTGAVIVACQVFCEVGKQVTCYSIQYYSGGSYPLPQTMLVILGEMIKLVTTILRSGCQRPTMDSMALSQSLKFLLPSIFYAVNNNIYFVALTLVPPPIWIILCSFRTVITATVYKFILHRNISWLQYTGALCIVASIIVVKLGDLLTVSSITSNSIPMVAIMLSMLASAISVAAALFTESLFKTSDENFLEQQFWLYLYGFFVSTMVHIVSSANISPVNDFLSLGGVSDGVLVLLAMALVFSSIGGLVVATILKRLDNIVKEYSGATANMVTALLCGFLFPEKFTFTVFILVALVLLFLGIYLYENKKPKLGLSCAKLRLRWA